MATDIKQNVVYKLLNMDKNLCNTKLNGTGFAKPKFPVMNNFHQRLIMLFHCNGRKNPSKYQQLVLGFQAKNRLISSPDGKLSIFQ